MKSKKIVAMIVAFAAFMAVATSGLAAITTYTTYDFVNKKVSVVVNVPAQENSEVTYLVENAGEIVYIDQKTATAAGASFNYKLDISEWGNDLTTAVQYGTNGIDIDETNAEAIEIGKVPEVANKNVFVEYFTDANAQYAIVEGNEIVTEGTEVYVQITAKEGFVVDTVTIGTTEHEGPGCYPVLYGQDIVVVTTEAQQDVQYTTEDVTDSAITVDGGDKDQEALEGKVVKTTLIKATAGKPTKVGVVVDGKEYPAYADVNKGTVYAENGVYAVRIITDEAVDITAYCE